MGEPSLTFGPSAANLRAPPHACQTQVRNLSRALVVALPLHDDGAEAVCGYWDTVEGVWRRDGVLLETVPARDGEPRHMLCEFTHLTDFGAPTGLRQNAGRGWGGGELTRVYRYAN